MSKIVAKRCFSLSFRLPNASWSLKDLALHDKSKCNDLNANDIKYLLHLAKIDISESKKVTIDEVVRDINVILGCSASLKDLKLQVCIFSQLHKNFT